MSDVLKKIRNFMEKEGIPGKDLYDLPTSVKTFPDGAHWRIAVFKWSAFAGYCSAAGFRVIEKMGANSANPTSDVSLPILASMRKAVNIPIDIYMFITDAEGGMFRIYDAPEIARIASPCYFKIEPGTSQADIYKPWVSESWHAEFMREKVKEAAIFQEIMERHAPELKLSSKGPADLVMCAPSIS